MKRSGLAALVAVAGYLAITQSLAQTIASTNIDLAHRLAPGNGRITAIKAALLGGTGASAADYSQADRLARTALRQDPTAVVAVSTLALNAQMHGDAAGARRLFRYAERLSRREAQTQLWAIEDAVSRGNIAGAIRHYDIVLRTKPELSDLLFPVLASASASQDVRVSLARTLAAKPAWSENFIQFLAEKGENARTSAEILGSLARLGILIPEEAGSRVVNALIAEGAFPQAWAYYVSLHPGSHRSSSRDPYFTANLKVPSLFDWTPIGNGEVITSIQSNGDNGLFDFSMPSGIGGPLLQQVQMLPPGTYGIAGSVQGIDQAAADLPYWTMSCRKDGRELGRVVLPASAQGSARFQGRFTVPSDCPVQTLVLVALPSPSLSGLAGQITHVQLSPTR